MKKNKIENRILSKLKQKSGETLTETLVGLLIGVLALTMLSTMIGQSAALITNSADAVDSYYTSCTSLITKPATGDNAMAAYTGEATLQFKTQDAQGYRFTSLSGDSNVDTSVEYYIVQVVDGTNVTSFVRK